MANSTLSTRGILPVDPTSPAPADPLSVLPHILLFIVLLLAFYPPPFRFRGAIICTLVALLDWRSTVSLWPPNIDDTRPFKYGIASSWIFVLPVVQRVLIQLPEKDFWRLDEEEETHRPSPREWSWKKLRWSISLFATPRAVGWNFGSRKMNAQREEIRRARLALSDTGGGGAAAFACYLVWDLVAVANRRVIVPRGEEWWSWDPEIMVKILWLEILMGITVYVGMNMQFDIAAAIGVGLRLNEPEDWPPLFGSITDCYTIANVWGKFWHQYMRQPCLGTSHFLLAHLNTLISRLPRRLHISQIPKHSLVPYLFHLLTAFAISTFFHALSVGTVAVGVTPVRGIIKDMAIFFMIQPFAAAFESFISTLVFWSAVFGRMVGYVWVLFWFYLTGQWFIRPYIDVGMVEWGLPFSFADWLLLAEGCR
ncbi:membrane bound O-acyl transferase family domain containing protein [Rhypophila decipiens]